MKPARVAALAVVIAISIRGWALGNNNLMPGQEALEASTRVVAEIRWHQSLDEALQAARCQDKLVFWVHMLGQINGST